MNWSVFFSLIAITMMIGGLVWYNETYQHNEPKASFFIILGALILAWIVGINV